MFARETPLCSTFWQKVWPLAPDDHAVCRFSLREGCSKASFIPGWERYFNTGPSPSLRLRLVGVRTVRGEWFVLISVLLSLQPTYSEPGTETIQQERTGRRDGTPSSLTQTLHLHSKWVMKYHVNDTFSCISYNLLTASHFRSWLLQEVRLGLCWLSAGWGLVWKSRCMWGCLYPDLLPSYTICIISYVWRLPQETCVNHFNKVRL